VKIKFIYILLLLVGGTITAQNDSISPQKEANLVLKDSLNSKFEYDPLAPSRAAFYSAVLPGLGQAYNKKYWKIPIVYAGIGTGIYLYSRNNRDYNRFRDAYKRRLAGFEDDEFQGISDDRLIDAQRNASRNRDVSIIVSIAFYLLGIIDANVDAHLRQYNISEDLSLQPNIELDNLVAQPNYGLSLKLNLQ